MSSMMGKNLKVSIFGQSHSQSIGCVVDGLPAGIKLDMDFIHSFMKRRAPGNSKLSTPRKEADCPIILSGIVDGVTCGAPLCAIIENTNVHSKDYDKLKNVPRPAHSDYPYFIKTDGQNDIRGGGHSSGRLTAPLCFAGAVALSMLKEKNIEVKSHILSIKDVQDSSFDLVEPFIGDDISKKDFPVICDEQGELMKEAIAQARSVGDSVGGVVECGVYGMPVGVGEPIFDGIENTIAKNIFGIPAVKGIEFGAGFELCKQYGSQSNDDFYINKEGKIKTKTNNHGGILGGMSSSMPIIFRVGFKPTPSIARQQMSVNILDMTEEVLEIKGRHDPCIVLRAVPVVEAVAALSLVDLLMDGDKKWI